MRVKIIFHMYIDMESTSFHKPPKMRPFLVLYLQERDLLRSQKEDLEDQR